MVYILQQCSSGHIFMISLHCHITALLVTSPYRVIAYQPKFNMLLFVKYGVPVRKHLMLHKILFVNGMFAVI